MQKFKFFKQDKFASYRMKTQEGLQFHVRRIGRGKLHVILLHGYGTSGSSWIPFILPLLNDFTFLVPDLPGHGSSKGTLPTAKTGLLDDYSNCISAIVKSLGENPYILVGFSVGAYATLNFLTKKVDREPLRYLHIDHTPFPQRAENWEGSMSSTLLKHFEDFHSVAGNQLSEIRTLAFKDVPDEIRSAYKSTLMSLTELSLSSTWLRTLSKKLHNFRYLGELITERVEWPWAFATIEMYRNGNFDLRNQLKEINVQTLLVSAGSDSLFHPNGMKFMSDQLPNSRLVEFTNSGHDLIFNDPIRFSKLFHSFLRGAEA